MLQSRVAVKKNVARILALKNEYGSTAIIAAIQKASLYKAYGADYIENILYQEMTPQNSHPPVRLKNDELNRITLAEPSLADYDAHIIEESKNDGR